jgi:hypothetical protein
MSDTFGSGGQNRPRFEDRTTGNGDRDPWNNRVKSDVPDNSGGTGGKDAGGKGGEGDNNTNKNKGGIDDDMIDNIWAAHVDNKDNKDNKDNNGGGGNGGGGNNDNQQRPDPKAQMDNYLKSVGLEPIAIDDAMKEKMQGGDFSDFITQVNTKLVNAHVKALSGAETMIKSAVEKAVNQTKTDMQSSAAGERLRDALHEAMPWTKKPSISPVAQSVAQRFIAKGMSAEDAVKGTKAYFDSMNNAMNNDGINKNRNANFSADHRSGQNDAPEGGWLSILNPANRG